MKGFDVLKVKSAVKSHNKFDLSRTHLTTMDFGEIVPLLAEETVPGDKFSIDGSYFSRMAPLVKPTYGKFSFKTVAGFVPYHMIAADADAWFAGKTSWEGTTPHNRYITVGALADFIIYDCITTAGANSGNTEFTWTNAAGTVGYAKFSAKGKYYVKVLNALGYAVPQGVDKQTGSTWYTTTSQTQLSAYPLLAFFKLYNDYMSQSQRFNTSQLSNFLNGVKYSRNMTNVWNYSTGLITNQGIKLMFDNLFLNYENDYFTSAWQQPNLPAGNFETATNIGSPASYGTVKEDANDTYLDLDLPGTLSGAIKLGQRSLDFLKNFDDWVRRNNYSGSRAVQQIYSRFGIKTDDYRSHYANILSTEELPIQVGDVTATADATASPLGGFAGKGIMNGSKQISCQVSDYGIILILGYFTVAPMMSYGYDRKVLRNSPLDYYSPEFDGMGADAISLGEIFENPIASSADTTNMNDIFGFTERYNSYRYGRDLITGEFRSYRNGSDMNVWHTGRLLGDVRAAGNLVAQSTSVNTLPQTDSEYNRMFSITNAADGYGVNHFYLTAQFKVNAIRPMLNLNQVPRLGEGDTAVPRNGNVIS